MPWRVHQKNDTLADDQADKKSLVEDQAFDINQESIVPKSEFPRLFPLFLSLIAKDHLKGELKLKGLQKSNHLPVIQPLISSVNNSLSLDGFPYIIDMKLADDLGGAVNEIKTWVLSKIDGIENEISALEKENQVKETLESQEHNLIEKADLIQQNNSVHQKDSDSSKNTNEESDIIHGLIDQVFNVKKKLEKISKDQNKEEYRLNQIDDELESLTSALKGFDHVMRKIKNLSLIHIPPFMLRAC